LFDAETGDSRRNAALSTSHAVRQQQRRRLAEFAKPSARTAIIQLVNTGLPLLACFAGLVVGFHQAFWIALLLVPPAALLVVRLFMIQHDCGHGSFFKSRRANDALGWIVGMVTLLPYTAWRDDHAVHHASSGNLDRRGTGDVTVLTVREYLARSPWRRRLYRLYRHPLVFFSVGPVYLMLVRYRIPTANPLRHWREWLSILGTNAAAGLLAAGLVLTVGFTALLLAYLPVLLLATGIGVWLFYIQHQFEETYWETGDAWDVHTAAVEGSSFYDLPGMLRWLTASIGFHHIHHLASHIPNYRLRACFEQVRELQDAKRLTLTDSFKCLRLALWDEERRRLVSFRDALWRTHAGASGRA
jgi:acyl-lipid omega-6 desaturase (Delta-12 desaturase)